MYNYLIHIKKIIEHIDNYNFTSVSQQNQIINSIRFLYKLSSFNIINRISLRC